MKSIIFCGLILGLGMSCSAGGDGRECMKKIHEAICKPDSLTDELIVKLRACKSDISAEHKTKAEEMYESCKGEGTKDADLYTNVKEADNKKVVIWACSKDFQKCLEEKNKNGGGEKPQMSDEMKEKIKKIMDCKKEVLGIK